MPNKTSNKIVVFHMDGCPACQDYLPRFKRIAVKYRPFVDIKSVNISVPSKALTADKYKIKAAPTTLILDATDEKILKRYTGSLSVGAIESVFAEAMKS